MSILATIWFITKILLVTLTIAATLTLVIALFHPLKFDLKLRATIKGQRAELWFVYLFKILQIGVIATPHTQDVVIKLFFWKKLIERQQRPKQSAPAKAEQATDDLATQATDKAENIGKNEPVEKMEPIKTESVENIEPGKTATVEEVKPINVEPSKPTEPIDKTVSPIIPEQRPAEFTPAEKSEAVDESEAIITESEPIQPTPVSADPIKPLAQVADEIHEKQQATPTADKEATETRPKNDWRQKMRKFKRDFSNRYRQLQKHLRLARQKWRILSPALKKFWQRGKKAFGIANPSLLLRYALHEPYLTGMLQGSMSVFAGLANRLGINFVPVPLFSEPGVYAKGCATAVIRPWRLVIATIGLLFEKKLWQELWLAFKWYRASKA